MVELLNPYVSAAKGIAEALMLRKTNLAEGAPYKRRLNAAYELRKSLAPYSETLDRFQELKDGESLGLPDGLYSCPVDGIFDNAYQILDMALALRESKNPLDVLTNTDYAPRFQ